MTVNVTLLASSGATPRVVGWQACLLAGWQAGGLAVTCRLVDSMSQHEDKEEQNYGIGDNRRQAHAPKIQTHHPLTLC